MEPHELKQAFDQFSPTQEQREAMRRRLLTEERKVRPMKKLKKIPVLAAAAALLLMTCAFAVVSGLDQRLLHYLGAGAEEEPLLSPMAVPLDIATEDSGGTLEAKQVLADRYTALILFEFTAPKGTVLDGDSYRLEYPNGSDVTITAADGTPIRSLTFGWELLEDDNPTDNRISLLYSLQPLAGEASLLGSTATLTFTQLEEGAPSEDLVAATGSWSCTIPLPAEDSGRDYLVDQPFEAQGRQVQLTSVYLSPLSLVVNLTEESDKVKELFDYITDHWQGNVFLTTGAQADIPMEEGGPFSTYDRGEDYDPDWQEQGRFFFRPEGIVDPSEIISLTFFGNTIPLQ